MSIDAITYFFRYAVPDAISRAWLIAKYRPFFKCPHCNGKGGAICGYYEPEWTECESCYQGWKWLVNRDMKWFEGRISLWGIVQCRASKWANIGGRIRLRDSLRCKLRFHRYVKDSDFFGDGTSVCATCYHTRSDKQNT